MAHVPVDPVPLARSGGAPASSPAGASRLRARLAATVLLVAVVLAGCGPDVERSATEPGTSDGDRAFSPVGDPAPPAGANTATGRVPLPAGGAVPVAPATTVPTTTVPTPPQFHDLLGPGVEAVAATAIPAEGPLPAWSAPPADAAPAGPASWDLPRSNEFGGPLHLRVVDQQGPWLRVQVPVRPNGTEGWVHRDSVELRPVPHRVEISLAERRLRVFQGGTTVMEATVAVGRPTDPTPTGTYYLRDSFAWQPGSVYGPYVLPLSAFSDTIEVINGGEAVVAIHGTNRPEQIGKAVSLGCVRMDNDDITALAHLIHPGTPVTITA